MAATTPKKELFGAAGVGDVRMFHPGLVCIKRTIDFSVSPVDITVTDSNDHNYQAVFGIPKSFVAVGAFFESKADKDGNYPSASGTVALSVADTTAGNDIAIGGTFTPSASAYKRQTILNGASVAAAGITQSSSSPYGVSAIAVPNTAVAFDSVDSTTGELLAFITLGADQTHGVITVGILGYVPDGDGLENVVTPDARVVVQEHTNVAGIDPWQHTALR